MQHAHIISPSMSSSFGPHNPTSFTTKATVFLFPESDEANHVTPRIPFSLFHLHTRLLVCPAHTHRVLCTSPHASSSPVLLKHTTFTPDFFRPSPSLIPPLYLHLIGGCPIAQSEGRLPSLCRRHAMRGGHPYMRVAHVYACRGGVLFE